MGRWSYDIMGGDAALDSEGYIYDLCDIEKYPDDENENELPAALLAEKQADLVAELLQYVLHGHESLLVLGYMMMERGAAMTQQTKEAIMLAIDADLKEWKGFPERIAVLTGFAKLVLNYDGKPVELHSKTIWGGI